MGRPLSEKELKRFGRVLAGHRDDKDRARWKRKAKGDAVTRHRGRKPVRENDEPVDELDAPDEEPQ